ncbi:MAG: hypothetical protein ACJ77G_12725 [Solirubrobacteraceae bacterium]
MKKILSYRPSASMVVAILAVILTCAGSATAARLITGRQIKNSSITTKDIRNMSLLKRDFRRGQLPRGPRGFQGPQGLRGATGARGTAGFGALRYAFDFNDAVNTGTGPDFLLAVCPAGTFPTGGDAGANATDDPDYVDEPSVITQQAIAFDEDGPFGYYADYDNQTGHDVDVFVDAVCANASSVAPALRAKGHRRGGRRFHR